MIPELLDINTKNIMDYEGDYLVLDRSNDHNVLVPTALMDYGHHFGYVPRSLWRNLTEDDLPQYFLHDIVSNLHAAPQTTIN